MIECEPRRHKEHKEGVIRRCRRWTQIGTDPDLSSVLICVICG
jgi:hypothetical protein